MIMEDSSNVQPPGLHGSGPGGFGIVERQQDDFIHRPQYSMPGILHFLQTEWTRFEMERSHWEVEKAEMQVSNMAGIVKIYCHVPYLLILV